MSEQVVQEAVESQETNDPGRNESLGWVLMRRIGAARLPDSPNNLTGTALALQETICEFLNTPEQQEQFKHAFIDRCAAL